MSLDPDYLGYPRRRRGMDHELYAASYLPDRKPVAWPNGAKVAVWIVPILQVFPLDMDPKPIVPPGSMTRPYPDYWNYTLGDYGTRVGIYRILDALAARRLMGSVAVNARLAERHPSLLRDCQAAGCELIAHGIDMGTLHGDHLDEATERGLIADVRKRLADVAGVAPRGWLSPAMAVSRNTTRLVAEAGFDYTCDWVNDELPYRMSVGDGRFAAMPLGYELSDLRLLHEYKQGAWDYEAQIIDAFHFLLAEARRLNSGRLLALPLHPWIIGAPHRIDAFERVLDAIAASGEAWFAGGDTLLNHWESAQ